MNALGPLVSLFVSLLAVAEPAAGSGGAASLLEKGERLFRDGDVAGALAAFTEAAAADPRDARPQYLKGVALEKKGDAAGAAAAYEKAIQLQPDFALAWNRTGRVALRRGKVPDAVAAQEKARKLDPQNAGFAADLCRALFEAKDAGKAAGACRAAVELDPKSPLGHYELMKVLVAKAECPAAKAELGKFKALPGVKPEAQKQADAIVASCKK